jgi:three-Cys-motif partner protein
MKEENFFDEQTLSSRIKANIVSEYFPKYCKIITKRHVPEQIGYFDLFSGPGKYKDGNFSTPLLIGQKCCKDPFLKDLVWMVFNDKEHSETLKENFISYFPKGTFKYEPVFGDKIVGECEKLDAFIKRNTISHRLNQCPTLLFIDPFGYKSIDTMVLAEFMKYWGNELFIFINSKRINAAINNEKFEATMRTMFPLNFDSLKGEIRRLPTLQERLKFIIDKLSSEFSAIIGKKIYYTAFKFQEEDIETTSHYILHITKSERGYDLIKQIYTDFANVGTIFDGINTYTFDPKKYNKTAQDLFDTASDNIEMLKEKIYKEFAGETINAFDLFDKHQRTELYSRRHYVSALRKLVDDRLVESKYIDGKNHNVSVLLIKECILKFK